MLCAGKAGQNLFCVLLESPGRKMKMSRLAVFVSFVAVLAFAGCSNGLDAKNDTDYITVPFARIGCV